MNASPAAASVAATLAPIVVDLVVPCPPDRAFDYFACEIGRWWPLDTHSVGRDRAQGVCFDPRHGDLGHHTVLGRMSCGSPCSSTHRRRSS